MRLIFALFFMVVSACVYVYVVATSKAECYNNVSVTGYYVPDLADYDQHTTKTIAIEGVTHTYNASFLAFVQVKEAGVSRKGEVLVYEGEQWKIRVEPLAESEKSWFPNEEDYVTTRRITTVEDRTSRVYPKAFVDEAGLQGSGKISETEYIGWPSECPTTDGRIAYLSPQCDDQWHVRTQPRDASGKVVERGVVATDKKYFDPQNPWSVTISPVPQGFETTQFKARDLGPAIVEKRIDVFTGMGIPALRAAMKLTGTTYTVCFTQPTHGK